MRVAMVPMFQDNYGYLVIDDETGVCAAVDPAEPEPILEAVAREGVELVAILNTHHHWDHTGGNEAILSKHPDLAVVGPAAEEKQIPGITKTVGQGDSVQVGALKARVVETPCHTAGHISYVFDGAVFCGDTLFVGGCGRFFEGTAAQMHEALNGVLAALPDDTLVYCGHEYTLGNLAFAASVDAGNEALANKIAWAKARREAGEPTVPSSIGEEKTYNPFMRVAEPALQEATGETDPARVMAKLREMKNGFAG